MPQGAVKKLSSGSKSGGRSQSTNPKKGKRSIAPRRTALVRDSGIRKKSSATLTENTERVLAAKAGHLELLAGGKRDKGKGTGAGTGGGGQGKGKGKGKGKKGGKVTVKGGK